MSEIPQWVKGGYYVVKLLNELAKFGAAAAEGAGPFYDPPGENAVRPPEA